jgi:hypothetical protein
MTGTITDLENGCLCGEIDKRHIWIGGGQDDLFVPGKSGQEGPTTIGIQLRQHIIKKQNRTRTGCPKKVTMCE